MSVDVFSARYIYYRMEKYYEKYDSILYELDISFLITLINHIFNNASLPSLEKNINQF